MGRLAAQLELAADELVQLRADAARRSEPAQPDSGHHLPGLGRLREQAMSALATEVDRLVGELDELADAVRAAAAWYAGLEDRLEGL